MNIPVRLPERRTVGALLEERAAANGDRPFLYFRDEIVTYAQLNERANRVAGVLPKLGIAKGDKVCLMLRNCPEFLYTWFGLAKLGAVEVPINAAFKGELLAYIVSNSGAKLLVVDEECLDRVRTVRAEMPGIERVVLLGSGDGAREVPWPCLPYDELLQGPVVAPSVEVKHSDLQVLLYTSGTTGPSKGAMLPHDYSLYWGEQVVHHLRLTSEDILYTCLPLFHNNAQNFSTMPALVANAALVLSERFSASRFWDEIRRYRATEFNCLGAMLTILYKQPERRDDADNPVRVVASAAVPSHLQIPFEERFGLKIVEGWGMTENGMPLVNPYDAPRIGSCGLPLTGFDVRIVDDDDNQVGPRQIGEIVLRPSEPYSMLLGYHGMPDRTLEAYRNLWFHSGDLGFRDEDGYFYFVDRKKDCIRRRGENISSYEVERTINAHPAVLESAAVGVPSDLGEEEVKIVLVLRPGASLSPEELIRFCEERLPYFAVPRYVEVRTALPKTATERVEKYRLKSEGIIGSTWDREAAGYKLRR